MRLSAWSPDDCPEVRLAAPSAFSLLAWARWRAREHVAALRKPPVPIGTEVVVQARRDLRDSAIVLATRDRPSLLLKCWETMLVPAMDAGAQVVLIDHESRTPEGRAAVERIRRAGARVIRVEGRFNYSAFFNKGAAATDRSRIFLLNDDVSSDKPDWWLQFHQLLDNGASVVGGLLLYPDGRVQHGGVVLGMAGATGHVGRFSTPEAEKLFASPRRVSAVTGACLALRRSDFMAVGGLDESLQIEFSDIDLCLKLGQRGKGCWIASSPRLIHHESATRGDPATGAHARTIRRDRARFLARWGRALAWEVYLDPSISRREERLRVAPAPYAVASSRK